jgi:hypothetical protein
VALSYVWGKARCGSAREKDQYHSHDGALPPLPATIEDAMTVTVKLGFRYLWVDKYCIDQNNPSELSLQIGLMDMIYHAASVTVIAAAGNEAHYGLPGVSVRSRTTQNVITMNKVTWVSARARLREVIKQSPWSARGWT